jgi:hypothetical protein
MRAYAVRELGRSLEGRQIDNLRTNVGADSLPAHLFPEAVSKIQAARFAPVKAEFVLMETSGDVRVAASLHVGIDTHGNTGDGTGSRSFF